MDNGGPENYVKVENISLMISVVFKLLNKFPKEYTVSNIEFFPIIYSMTLPYTTIVYGMM